MADIFISYARGDRNKVERLATALKGKGYSIWWDRDIQSGVEFSKSIEKELLSAKAVIVAWSAEANDSRWVKDEAEIAVNENKLLAIALDAELPPIGFRQYHAVDFSKWTGDIEAPAFQDIARAVAANNSGDPPEAEKAAPPVANEKRTRVSICVLPFVNMAGDPEQEYFSDGISEDIITDLGKVSALSVVSRNTAFTFKGKVVDVAQIAQQTQVSHVLEGSVRKSGNRVRITAQLINAGNDVQIWAERFDRDLDDIFALQDEISEAVVKALKLTLLPEEKRALEQRSTSNAEAYKIYLMARQFSIMGDERHQEIIIRICKRAVELDPNYARAWATMAIAYWYLHRYGAATDDDVRHAAERAIALDRNLPDAHAALGASHHGQGQYELGLEACEVAIGLEPNSYEGNRMAGLCCMPLRRYDDAIRYFETAAAAIETEYYAASMVIQCYAAKANADGARAAAKRALARIENIIAVEPDHGNAIAHGAYALATLGEIDRTKEWAARGRLLDPDNVHLQFNLVCAMSCAGEIDDALEMLECVVDKLSKGHLMWIETDTDFDPIRDDPRFAAMIARANTRLSDEALTPTMIGEKTLI